MAVLRHLIPGSAGQVGGGGAIWFPARDIPTESLIVGALEAAFWEMVRIEAIANDLKAPSPLPDFQDHHKTCFKFR